MQSKADGREITVKTPDEIAAMSRDEAVRYFTERKADIHRALRELNADCLRECLERCPDRLSRCASCSRNEEVVSLIDGLMTLGDGRTERVFPGKGA